ncbi:MAG: helicase-related protein [Hymenobacter sp.]
MDGIVRALNKLGYEARGISSDRTQEEREEIMRAFKNKQFPILVATDVLQPRHRHRQPEPRGELRHSPRRRGLRAPHWPHGARPPPRARPSPSSPTRTRTAS